MPYSDDILRYLGTTPEYATPAQMEDLRSYGNRAIPVKDPQVSNGWGVASEMLRALSGRMALNNSYNMQSDATKSLLEAPTPGYNREANSQPAKKFASATPTPNKVAIPSGSVAGGKNYVDQLIQVESGGNPNAVSGSYKGLGQFGPSEEAKYGINNNNRTDPNVQKAAIVASTKENYDEFKKRMGREPTDGELYLMHQQGPTGATQLLSNPDVPAWKVIRPYYKSDAMARLAISGNGGNPDAPASEFTNKWISKFGNGTTFSEVIGGGSPSSVPTTAPAQAAPPGAIPPGAIAAQAAADGGPVAPPMGLGGPTQVAANEPGPMPVPQGPITAPTPSIEGDTTPDMVPMSAAPQQPTPQQMAQNSQPIDSMNQSFETKFPTPPPSNYGFSPQQMNQFSLMNPDIANRVWENRVNQFTPQYMDIEGGKRWIVPATGETGFIPVPRYGKAKIGDMDIETVQRIGEGGKVGSEFLIPGGGSTNGKAGGLNNLNDIIEFDRTQKAETESRKQTATKNADTVAEDVKDAIQAGNTSSKTLQIVGILEDLDKMPDTADMHTGPWAEKMLGFDKIVKDITGVSFFNPSETVGKAEVLQKLGVQLSAAMAKELTNRPTQWDFQTFIGNNPSLFLTPEGRRTLVDLARQVSTYNKAVGQAAMGVASSDPKESRNWGQIKQNLYDKHEIKLNYNGQVINNVDEAKKAFGTGDKPKDTAKPRMKYVPGKGWQ